MCIQNTLPALYMPEILCHNFIMKNGKAIMRVKLNNNNGIGILVSLLTIMVHYYYIPVRIQCSNNLKVTWGEMGQRFFYIVFQFLAAFYGSDSRILSCSEFIRRRLITLKEKNAV